MANDFRLNGDYYLSKAGAEGNPGTKDAPLNSKVFLAGRNGLGVMGAGAYIYGNTNNEGIPQNGQLRLIADGTVKLLGLGSGLQYFGFYGTRLITAAETVP